MDEYRLLKVQLQELSRNTWRFKFGSINTKGKAQNVSDTWFVVIVKCVSLLEIRENQGGPLLAVSPTTRDILQGWFSMVFLGF